MKRQLSLILAALLCLSMLAALVACDKGDQPADTTGATTEAPAEQTTEVTTEADTDEETTDAAADATTEEGTTDTATAPVEGAINIGTAEELIAWANTIIEDGTDYFEVTINFTDDIDLAGYNWIPVDGAYLDCVVFEGNGHTIKNMTIAGTDEPVPDAAHMYAYGFGFIQNVEYDLEFKNLNFDGANITAWERHVGVFVGNVYGAAWVTFDNCHVSNVNIDGWMEYKNKDEEPSEHAIAFRIAGFVGANFGGTIDFNNCSLKDAKMSGFHNFAAFIGYDGTGRTTADNFTNCHVENMEITFSYCLSNSYTVDMPKKYVSVFYNDVNWVDNIDDFMDTDNTYKDVYFIDYTAPENVYDPHNFRSWTYEEYLASKQS